MQSCGERKKKILFFSYYIHIGITERIMQMTLVGCLLLILLLYFTVVYDIKFETYARSRYEIVNNVLYRLW